MMKTLVVYELVHLDEEKLRNAYNNNLQIAWRFIFKRVVPDSYADDKNKFEDKVLPSIIDDLEEMGKRGRFDVRLQSPQGFFSLLEGRFLTV